MITGKVDKRTFLSEKYRAFVWDPLFNTGEFLLLEGPQSLLQVVLIRLTQERVGYAFRLISCGLLA